MRAAGYMKYRGSTGKRIESLFSYFLILFPCSRKHPVSVEMPQIKPKCFTLFLGKGESPNMQNLDIQITPSKIRMH
jgi:hypothetical protein